MKRKIFAAALLFLFCLCAFCLFLPLLLSDTGAEAQGGHYRGVVELWHIETFEGGSSGRENWLNKRAAKFEAANSGLFVHVSKYTYEQAAEKLAAGDTFDLVSFSCGTGNLLLPYLAPLETDLPDLYDAFLRAGTAENVLYAAPYCVGTYALFARTGDLEKLNVTDLEKEVFRCATEKKIGKNTVALAALGCGFGPFNSPLSALTAQGGFSPDYSLTQYQAYERFLSGKSNVVLLGTQRDMYRLKNRMEQGKTDPLTCVPLGAFNDLAQYVALSATAGEKAQSCRAFVSYLLSETAQKTLVNCYMLSPCGIPLYTDEWMAAAEKLLPDARTVNVFSDLATLERVRESAQKGETWTSTN